MISPLDRDYYNMMKNRSAKENIYDKNDYLNIDTQLIFTKLLKLFAECEGMIEEWRVNLESMVFFSIRDTFDRIDVSRKGYLTKQDVIYLIIIKNSIILSNYLSLPNYI